jgi:hypothetical protein
MIRAFVSAHTIPHYVTNQTTSQNAGALTAAREGSPFMPVHHSFVAQRWLPTEILRWHAHMPLRMERRRLLCARPNIV